MTEVEISNLALAHLGMQEITSLTANNPSSEACNLYFDIARDELLEEHRWAFATATEFLTDSTDVSSTLHPQWDYWYAYPSNCAKVWNVYNEGTIDDKEDQDFEKILDHTNSVHVIGSDLDEAIAEFTYKLEDTTLWDQKFIDAFTYRLAGKMGNLLTGDKDGAFVLLQASRQLVNIAKTADFAEKRKKPNQTSSYIECR